jgi:diacylglycerol kinase family enzyme
LVEVLNLGMTGPRMLIGPSAEPGDQLLDLVYLTERERQHMIDWLEDGPDDKLSPLQSRKAEKVALAWHGGPLRIDDKVFGEPKLSNNITITIEPHGLRILVPRIA